MIDLTRYNKVSVIHEQLLYNDYTDKVKTK